MADLVSNLQNIYATKLQIKNAIGTDSDIFADYPSYINSLKPSGYAYITTNGDHNVNAYSYVNVNVPTGGGAAVLGNLSVTENGQYSASNYSYDGFDTVDVNVPQPTLGSANITANGNYNASDLGFDGLNSVIVNVPTSGGSSHTGSSVYDAMTIKEALDWVYAHLKQGESSTDWFYVKGIIAEASSPITAQYGNWNAWLTDDGQMHYQTDDPTLSDLTKCLYVFRAMFYGHSTEHATWDPNTDMQIHVGDQVIMYCQLRWHTSNVPRIINGNTIKQGVTAQNQLTISQSGTYDVQNYVSAYVDVQGGGYPETTYSLTGYVLDSTRLMVNDNTVNISNGDYLDLSLSYNLGQEITLPNCVQVYADRFIAANSNVSNVFWFNNNNTITYTGNTHAFTYTGNITLSDHNPIYTEEKNYWYGQYPQKEIKLFDVDGHDYYITESDYNKHKDSSIGGLTANISYITDNNDIKFAIINSINAVQYTGFIYESVAWEPTSDINFTSETIDGHTGFSCNLVLQDLSGQGGTGELVGGGLIKATTDGENYNDIQLYELNIHDGTILSEEQRYFGKFDTTANLNVGWYDNNNTCASMKLFIYLDGSTWVAKYIWTLTA